METVSETIKTFFISLTSLFLLLLDSVVFILGTILSLIYIFITAAIPIVVIGMFTADMKNKDLNMILVVLLVAIVIPLFLLVCAIALKLSRLLGSLFQLISYSIFSQYYFIDHKNHIRVRSLMAKPKITPILILFLWPYYLTKLIYIIIDKVFLFLYIPATIVSVGIAGYSIYSFIVDFTDPIAIKLKDSLSYFSTHTYWGDLTCVILVLLAIIGFLIMFTRELRNNTISKTYQCVKAVNDMYNHA